MLSANLLLVERNSYLCQKKNHCQIGRLGGLLRKPSPKKMNAKSTGEVDDKTVKVQRGTSSDANLQL